MTMAAEAKAEVVVTPLGVHSHDAAEAAELVSPPAGESVAELAEAVLQAAESSTAAAREAETPSPAPTPAAPALAPSARRPLFRDLPRPAAMPQMGALDAFIPSAPAGVTPLGVHAHDTRREMRPEPLPAPAAPVRESVKASPMSAAAKRAFPSLFDRITARSTRAEATPEPPRQKTQPSAESAVQGGGMAAAMGAKLKADPADRINAAAPEDDLLDIPAFLRRQAN